MGAALHPLEGDKFLEVCDGAFGGYRGVGLPGFVVGLGHRVMDVNKPRETTDPTHSVYQ